MIRIMFDMSQADFANLVSAIDDYANNVGTTDDPCEDVDLLDAMGTIAGLMSTANMSTYDTPVKPTVGYDPDEMPDTVRVQLRSGKIVTCLVIGQALRFPKVMLPDGGSVEFARDTLARSAKEGNTLHV